MFKLLLRNVRLAYRADRFYVTSLVITNAIYAALDLSSLFILARLIDLFIGYIAHPTPAAVHESWWWFGALVMRWIAANLCNQFLDYLGDVHKPQVLNYADNMIIAKLDRLPTDVIESSEFQNRMTNIHTFGKVKFVENLNLVGALVQSAAQCVYAMLAILLNNPLMALIIIVVSIPEVRYNLKIIRRMRDLNERMAIERRRSSYYVALTQDLAQYFNLKSYNLFAYFLQKIKKSQQAITAGTRAVQRYHKPRSIAIGTAANLVGQFVPKGYYVWATLTSRITIGQFQLYYRLIDGAYNSSYQVYMTYLQISENNIYVGDLFELLDHPEPEAITSNMSLDLTSIELEFRNVSFSYPESTGTVLQDISFKVKPGEKLAIVGRNGSGKTTITRLINKFYEPTKGTILVNGVDLQTIDAQSWRRSISNLSQDVAKYYLTAKESVVIGDPDQSVDDQQYRKSVRDATIAGDIDDLPKQDDNMLGRYFPGGVNLSGGQWQKLNIARSFYRKARLLLLDEPTSAVDTKSEQEIFDVVFGHKSHQTQIIVSHKFSNIKKANQILVLDKGHIIEQGDHARLMAENGQYAKLYAKQSAAFTE